MKLHHIFACLAVVIVASHVTVAQNYAKWSEPGKDPLVMWGGVGNVDEVSYRMDLRESDFVGSPTWNPADKEIPLKPHEAYGMAEKELRKVVGNFDGWIAHDISCIKLPEESSIWYYEVRFLQLRGRGSLSIVVRLDGKVIMPKPEKK